MAATPSLVEGPRQTLGLVAVNGRTFPLRASRIQARAAGGLATTVLVQEYDNPHDVPLEVIYTLPLPADGAVVGYTIRLGERVVRGEVDRREVARDRYRRALEEGRTASLLEQERADTFSQTLGSLPPGTPVRVEIEVLHPLGFWTTSGDAGPEWEYRFPTVVGVRYEGAPGRVPDVEALDVDRADGEGPPVRVEAELFIMDGAPEAMAPRSPSHALDVRGEGGGVRVALASPSRLDRDVVVRWRAANPTVGAQHVEGRGLSGDDGRYVALTLTPPIVPQAAFARDVTLLLDASGSMHGEPLDYAKQIVEALLGSLSAGDRFELLAFSNQVITLTDDLGPATPDRVRRALDRLRALQAGGGTEMTEAIVKALEVLRPDTQRQVVLLTDGYVGFEHEVVGKVLSRLPSASRLHVVGVGSAPNRTLTRGASRAGRGVELLASTADDAREAAKRILRATAAPILTDLLVRGLAVLRVAPERPRDVLAGQPALFALELRPEGGVIEIEGRLAGCAGPWTHQIQVGPRAGVANGLTHRSVGTPESLPLGAFFGRERVEDCEMRLAAAGDARGSQAAILDEIEALGLRHRIPTRRTSLVAISEDPTVDARDPRRRERLAVELPAGVSAEGVAVRAASLQVHSASRAPQLPGPVECALAQADSLTADWITADDVFDVGALSENARAELDTLSAESAHLRATRQHVIKEIAATEALLRETEARLDDLRQRSYELGHEAATLAARLEELGRMESSLRPTVEISGRLTRLTEKQLVAEFEIPTDGLAIPDNGDDVVVQWASGGESTARVIGTLSTRPGPQLPGLTVRLAVEASVLGSSAEPSRLHWHDLSGRVVIVHIR